MNKFGGSIASSTRRAPGSEPGVDPRRATVNALYSHVHELCEIEVVDYSASKVEFNQYDNQGFLQFINQNHKPAWAKVRWVNIAGISWDVLSSLALAYGMSSAFNPVPTRLDRFVGTCSPCRELTPLIPQICTRSHSKTFCMVAVHRALRQTITSNGSSSTYSARPLLTVRPTPLRCSKPSATMTAGSPHQRHSTCPLSCLLSPRKFQSVEANSQTVIPRREEFLSIDARTLRHAAKQRRTAFVLPTKQMMHSGRPTPA